MGRALRLTDIISLPLPPSPSAQVEQAHWFYEDYIRPERPELKSFALKDFVKTLFDKCSVLKRYKEQVGDILLKFNAYKSLVPVMGAMILDPELEHVLLLRGIKSSSSWGFPKGKVNQEEADLDCAIREVLEETSFDIGPMVCEEDAIEVFVKGQRRKMFIVAGVDRQTLFAPKMRGEVGNYAWMPVSELPTRKEHEGAGVVTEQDQKLKFWGVWRFIKPLKVWIKKEKQNSKKKKKRDKRKERERGEKDSSGGKKAAMAPAATGNAGHGDGAAAAPAVAKADPPTHKPRNTTGNPFLDFTIDREKVLGVLSL